MKRVLVLGSAASALAVLVGGCFVTSAQVFVNYALPSPFTVVSTGSFLREVVDLNTIGDYTDHKDNLKGVADVAILGRFVNEAGSGGGVQVYITPDETDLAPADIPRNATLLWGPVTIGATGSVHVVDWRESAKLLNAAGKAILVHEVKGDGAFTLYAIASGGTSTIRVEKSAVALVLDAGL